MLQTDVEPNPSPRVTLKELDEILDQIAATSPFSSMHLRRKIEAKRAQSIQPHNALLSLFRWLHSSEAKWMIRVLLKTYSPVHVPEILTMQQFHFLLPDLLAFQGSFNAAVKNKHSKRYTAFIFRCSTKAQIMPLTNSALTESPSVADTL